MRSDRFERAGAADGVDPGDAARRSSPVIVTQQQIPAVRIGGRRTETGVVGRVVLEGFVAAECGMGNRGATLDVVVANRPDPVVARSLADHVVEGPRKVHDSPWEGSVTSAVPPFDGCALILELDPPHRGVAARGPRKCCFLELDGGLGVREGRQREHGEVAFFLGVGREPDHFAGVLPQQEHLGEFVHGTGWPSRPPRDITRMGGSASW